MKKIIISWLIIVWTMIGCKTTKMDTSGNANPTHNTKHLNKIHPYGFFAAGKYIQPPYPVKTTVKK